MRSTSPHTAQIPARIFSAFLPEIRQDLIDKEIFTPRNHLIARTIIDFLNPNKEINIHDTNYHEGWTFRFSYAQIAEQSGFSVRSVIRAIDEMLDAGILERKKRVTDICYQYRFKAYDRLHKTLQDNPPSDIVTTTHAYKVTSHATVAEDDLPTHDTVAYSKELIQEEAPIPTGPGTRAGIALTTPTEEGGDFKSSQKAKPADSSLSENSSSPKPQPASQQPKQAQPSQNPPGHGTDDLKGSPPPAVPSDVVPNSQIGKLLDNLTASTSMNAAPTDDNIEDFVRLLKPDQAVISYPEVQKAVPLHQRITKLLADAAIEMPPLLFFKHCLKHTDALIADGKLDVRPTSPNFFMKGHTGPQALEHCINQLRGENRAHTDKQRTDKYLSELKSKRGTPMPPEIRAKLFGKQ